MFPVNNLLSNRFLAWTQDVKIPAELVRTGLVTIRLPDQTYKTIDLEEELDTTAFVSPNQQDALAAFHHFTLKYGYGTPVPENRVGKGSRKSAKDDEFLVAIRHNEFRQSHNCDPTKFAKYRNILINRCNKFWMHNAWVCQSYGMEYDDLKQYAMCWLVNFCGLYENQETIKTEDNYRLLQNYLKQRFNELQGIVRRKNLNIQVSKPDFKAIYVDKTNDLAELMNEFKGLKAREAAKRIQNVINDPGTDRQTLAVARKWLKILIDSGE